MNLMSEGDQVSTSAAPDDQGRFRIAELSAGKWTVVVRDTGHTTLHQETVSLKAGEMKELKLRAQKGQP